MNWAAGDFNYDGTVNALDFNALASRFGQGTSPAPALQSAVAASLFSSDKVQDQADDLSTII
jgi:hypothetical protein